MIVRCPKCRKRYEVPDERAGKQAQCGNCGMSFPAVAARRAELKPGQIAVVCPNCGKRRRAPVAYLGKTARCKACNTRFIFTAEMPGPPRPSEASPAPPATAPPPPPPLPTTAALPDKPPPAVAIPPTMASATPAGPPPIGPVQTPPSRSDPAVGTGGPAPAWEMAVYPWEYSPQLKSKVAAYVESGNCATYPGTFDRFLNGLNGQDPFRKTTYKANLLVCPDVVAVEGRMGCLGQMVNLLPEALQAIVTTVLAAVFMVPGLIGLIIGGGTLLVGGVVLLALLALFWYIMIPLIALAFGLGYLVEYLKRLRLAAIARRILADPTSSYAIRRLHAYTDVIPSIWQRGDVVQLARLDTRRGLFRRSLILVVQDRPLENPVGCFNTGAGVWLGRWLHAERRVSVFVTNGGSEATDVAAGAMSQVLGVGVERAEFVRGTLRLI